MRAETFAARRQRGRWSLALVASPAVLLFVVLGVLPFLLAVYYSTLDYSPVDPSKPGTFIGAANYRAALGSDPVLRRAALNTAIFCLTAVTAEVAAGLAVALLVWQWVGRNRLLMGALLLPAAMSPLVVGLLWKLILQSEFGVGSFLLRESGLVGEGSLLGGDWAFALIVMVDFWQWTPFVSALFIAGLVTQPQRLLEIARLDGATTWGIFRTVTMPYIAPLLGAILMLRLVDAFREFEKITVLTGGGPGLSTELLNVYLWRVSFREWDLGYGAALSVIVYVVALTLAYVLFRALAKWAGAIRGYA